MPLGAYVAFLKDSPRLAAFGFGIAFASSYGQTFFIGVFGPAVQSEFGLGHTAWSTIYLLGTLASAALLPWTGKQIDRVRPGVYTGLVVLAAALACAVFSLAWTPAALVLGIFALRQTGQGLMSHLAITTMARYFDRQRGRAIAIATLGFAAGEALLPFLAVLAIEAFGWRWTYRGVGLALGLAVVPAMLLVRSGAAHRARAIAGAAADPAPPPPAVRDWTRAEVLRDRRFYLLLPGLLTPSLVVTAMFFHHLTLADTKGWTHGWMTGSYVLYAASTTFTSLAAGGLIDRFGAARIVPGMLLPQALGLVAISSFDHPLTLWPYLALIGVCTGISHTAVSALWAELYGIAHIGAIRSLAASLSVFASALGPIALGGLVDLGLSIDTVCLVFAGLSVAGAGLMTAALHRPGGG